MKPLRRDFPQATELLSLFFALLLVLFVAVLTYRAWTDWGRSREQVDVTRKVVDGSTELLSSLKDAETGQRGFLLTGEDRYLDPYRKAQLAVPASLDALANVELARGRPDQLQRIERLRPLVKEKMDELGETIELRRTQGMEAALAIVLTDRGQNAMDRIRTICAEIQTASYDLLREQTEKARQSAYQAGLIGTVGSAGVFVFLLLATITIERGTLRRQRLIENLRESEKRTSEAREWLNTTIASIGDGVIATDTAGRISFLNPVAQSLTGWTQDEAAGKPLEEIFIISNEETGALVENPVARSLREKKIVGLANHTRLTARDGRRIPIDDSAAPICDAAGNVSGVVLIFRDVTERKQIEDAARRRAAQFEALLSQAPIGAYLVDADFRILQVNPTAVPVFGNIPDLIGRDFDEVMHTLWPQKYADEIVGRFRHTLQTGEPYITAERIEKRLDRGALEYYEWQINRIPLPEGRHGVVCYFRDISQQVLTRESIAGSEARLRFMAESMPQKIFTAKPNGDVDYFNQQWMDFTGLSFEQIKSWGWQQLVHPEDLSENMRLWRHSIETGEPFKCIHRFKRFDGIYRWHLSRAQAMRDAEGKISMWIGSNTEIHEQKEIENELRRANDDLKQFAFAASHDLQEPLRMITSYSQLLVKGYRGELDGEAAMAVNFIAEGTHRMRELLADLLAYTQVSEGGGDSQHSVDLNLVFQKAAENCEAAIKESKATVTSGPLPTIRGHEPHFVQLFQNLIGNAIKYRSESVPCVHVSAAEMNGVWRLAVKDNGIGIEPQYHQTIFGVFKRLHGRSIPGTGIGLAICQRVIERYGGRIWVESQVNQGATFYCTLPSVNGGAG